MPRSSLHNSLLTVVVSAVTSAIVATSVLLLGPYARPELVRRMLGFAPTLGLSGATKTLSVPRNLIPPGALAEDDAIISIVKKNQPAVVAVLVSAPPSRFQKGFELEPVNQQVGGGSGFFVTPDGIVVTNKHVVMFDNAEYTVLTSDGKKLKATVLATDPTLDLAFLKVDGQGFPSVEFGDSDALVPGQTVIAIGNALDEFRNSVTKGVVSGLNRRIVAGDGEDSEVIEEAIQTDAAINPGNSGGPLIDLNGAVVGLNTAVSEQGQLLGFALPSNVVRRDVDSLQKLGRIARAFLGVRYQIIDEELIKQNQLKVDHGALIVRGTRKGELAVAPGSPADKAGLVENDIILEVDGHPIDEDHSLASLVGRHSPGDSVTLKFQHAGTVKTTTVTLDELKP